VVGGTIFFFSNIFSSVGEIKFFNRTNFIDQLHRKFSIFTHTDFTDRHLVSGKKKNLAEKVGELTKFANFGAEEKISTNTDRRSAIYMRV
jgi:hypothetical protein